MKYIVTKDVDNKEEIFVFPRNINHDCFAEAIEGIRTDTVSRNWSRVRRIPIHAGFVNTSGYCHGESETLGLGSRNRADTKLLGILKIVGD